MKDFDPDIARCDPEVYKSGELVCSFHARAVIVEAWVRAVRKDSGQRVDWHYVGGYALVKYIGDRAKVLASIEKLRGQLKAECCTFVAAG